MTVLIKHKQEIAVELPSKMTKPGKMDNRLSVVVAYL